MLEQVTSKTEQNYPLKLDNCVDRLDPKTVQALRFPSTIKETRLWKSATRSDTPNVKVDEPENVTTFSNQHLNSIRSLIGALSTSLKYLWQPAT
jgi:hypothetical protein